MAPTPGLDGPRRNRPADAGTPLTSYGSRILDSSVPGAYPIAATTYLIVHDRYADVRTCDEVVRTARWVLSSHGQATLPASNYAPVGAAVRSRALGELAAVRDRDGNACVNR